MFLNQTLLVVSQFGVAKSISHGLVIPRSNLDDIKAILLLLTRKNCDFYVIFLPKILTEKMGKNAIFTCQEP